jgi:integrase
MARTARNQKLDTRTARSRLGAAKSPYWTSLSPGHSLGYRKGKKGGVWLAKLVLDGLRREHKIAAADDTLDADGVTILSFAQAQSHARDWFEAAKRTEHGANIDDLTVADAIDGYVDAYMKEGKGLKSMRYAIDAHILPKLGDKRLLKLSHRQIEEWHRQLAELPPRTRTRTGQRQQYRDTSADPEAKRRRKSTTNRMLTVLKAALNHAAREYSGLSDDAWRHVKPFREADAAKVRYLGDNEARRIVNACEEPFRALVSAALVTGCRYGELAALRVADYDRDARTIFVGASKSGKSRYVVLTDEAVTLFDRATFQKGGVDLLLPRADGRAWGKSHQVRPLELACQRARISPSVNFHVMRHTYASRLVMQGADLIVVAKQLGHSDTRMVERHYGHLAESYVATSVRAAFTDMGLVASDNVTQFEHA